MAGSAPQSGRFSPRASRRAGRPGAAKGLRRRVEPSGDNTAIGPGFSGAPSTLLQGSCNGSVRLHDEPRGQDRSAQAPDPQEHLALVLPRRQDRRARPERLGQVDAAQDHGRHRPGHRRRGDADARPEDRLPAAGAGDGSGPDRAPGGRGRHRRRARREEAARRGLRRVRRARRRLRRARRRAGRARGADRRRRQREHRPAARDRRRRAAPRAVGRRRSASSRAARSAASRCAACCSRKPDMLLLDEPTNHLDAESVDWLEQFLQRFPGTVVAITHDRYFLDNAAEWILELDRGSGIPYKGNYSTWLEQKEAAPRAGAEDRGRAHQGDEEGARVGAPEPEGPPGQEQGAPGALRGALRRRVPEAQRDQRDLHPGRRAARPRGDRVRERQQELRRPAADRRPQLQGAGRRDRRHHRPERRRQVDAVPHDRRQGEARQRHRQDRPDREDGVRRAEPRGARERQDGLAGRLRRPRQPRRRQVRDAERAPTSAASTSRATTSRSWSATSRAASAAGCTWPRR